MLCVENVQQVKKDLLMIHKLMEVAKGIRDYISWQSLYESARQHAVVLNEMELLDC